MTKVNEGSKRGNTLHLIWFSVCDMNDNNDWIVIFFLALWHYHIEPLALNIACSIVHKRRWVLVLCANTRQVPSFWESLSRYFQCIFNDWWWWIPLARIGSFWFKILSASWRKSWSCRSWLELWGWNLDLESGIWTMRLRFEPWCRGGGGKQMIGVWDWMLRFKASI